MTAKIMTGPAETEALVSGHVVADRLGVPYESLLRWRKNGRIPGVAMNARVIRFSLRQVAEALGIDVSEAAK
ncbi:MAG: hypothetical protein IAF94_07670 [Pirellulaceae bacterium]|nr:hypothetical protein [Pirellulaceae bacterium]